MNMDDDEEVPASTPPETPTLAPAADAGADADASLGPARGIGRGAASLKLDKFQAKLVRLPAPLSELAADGDGDGDRESESDSGGSRNSMMPIPEPVGRPGCNVCAGYVLRRKSAYGRYDFSAVTDANVLLRRHLEGLGGPCPSAADTEPTPALPARPWTPLSDARLRRETEE